VSIAALRQQLAEIVQGARPAMPGLATGLAALDAALPEHGLPRGRLTEITGAPGSGLTTVARHLVATTLRAGWWVAYVDATRTLAPRDWAALGTHEGLWVVRPEDGTRSAWCADVLLRSGAFGLVILDGAPALTRTVAVRLVRLARASDAAFVVLAPHGQHAGVAGALQLRVQRASTKRRPADRLDLTARLTGATTATSPPAPAPLALAAPATTAAPADTAATTRRTRRLQITIEKGGTAQRVEVEYASEGRRDGTANGTRGAARRVREDPQIPDRRGVARRNTRRALGRPPTRPA
jgi:recombination protein RecA